MTIHIHGGNNRIANGDYYEVKHLEGDLIVERSRPFMQPDDPNVIRCPHKCGQLTWWNVAECWNCHRPVLQLLMDQKRQARKEVLNTRGAIAFFVGLGFIFIGSEVPDNMYWWFTLPGLLAWGGAILCAKASEKT